MIPLGSVLLILVLVLIGVAAAVELARRRIRAGRTGADQPLEQRMARLAAAAHALLFTIYWSALVYQFLMPSPWGRVDALPLLIWLPLFVAHMAGQAWAEGRAESRTHSGPADINRERQSYRDGYADGRRDALQDARLRLDGEGELVEDDFAEDYLDLDPLKRKRG